MIFTSILAIAKYFSPLSIKLKKEHSTKCNSLICCRTDSPLIHGDFDKPGKWGDLGPCDLPMVFSMLNNQKIENSI